MKTSPQRNIGGLDQLSRDLRVLGDLPYMVPIYDYPSLEYDEPSYDKHHDSLEIQSYLS